MEQKIFHGEISPADFADALIAAFNRGNLRAQRLGDSEKAVVQIATRERSASGGKTALTVYFQQVKEGVLVKMGRQEWLGVAASLGVTAVAALLNPLNLLSRLDDLAQDIENLQLDDKVWEVIEERARAAKASHEISEKLSRVTCAYCGTANPVGAARCLACGAPLGDAQPRTCPHCGYVISGDEEICSNCGKKL